MVVGLLGRLDVQFGRRRRGLAQAVRAAQAGVGAGGLGGAGDGCAVASRAQPAGQQARDGPVNTTGPGSRTPGGLAEHPRTAGHATARPNTTGPNSRHAAAQPTEPSKPAQTAGARQHSRPSATQPAQTGGTRGDPTRPTPTRGHQRPGRGSWHV
nr:hypothetical protein [uncultured bacterium]